MYHCWRRPQDRRHHADHKGAKVSILYHCHICLAATATLVVLFCPTTGFRVYRCFLRQSWLMTPSSQAVPSKQWAMQAEYCLRLNASRCCHHHVSLLGLAHLQAKCGLHSSSCNRHLHEPGPPHFADKRRAVFTSTPHMADQHLFQQQGYIIPDAGRDQRNILAPWT